ncbi:F-box only protein 42-like isoform X2 [Acanthaster planci]|nr:F-box only protein 42-like isoform X2 [Acanthaster planci]
MHSACFVDGIMYMFGGMIPATANTHSGTCFCDLQMLDLRDRTWTRLLATGQYPSPKAGASMVHHSGSLILYGGWAPPVPNPPHQPPIVFNDLHMYDITRNHWRAVVTSVSPPPLANHRASLLGDLMIIFGGSSGSRKKENDVWVFSLKSMTWNRMEIDGKKPPARDKHIQVELDDGHILIIAGLGNLDKELHDVWMLDISEIPWCWREIEVKDKAHAAPKMFCHAACKIDECVVFFSCSRTSSNSCRNLSSQMSTQFRHRQLRDHPSPASQSHHSTKLRGVETGSLKDLHPQVKRLCNKTNENSSQNSEMNDSNLLSVRDSSAHTSNDSIPVGCPCSPGCTCKTPVTFKLSPVECRIAPNNLGFSSPLPSSIYHGEQQYVLDISRAVNASQVRWLEIPDQNVEHIPEALYPSMCVGRAQVIRFGGFHLDNRCPRAINNQYYAY